MCYLVRPEYLNLCKKLGIQVGEEQEVTSRYEFLGVTYDHVRKEVSLTRKLITKIAQLEITKETTHAEDSRNTSIREQAVQHELGQILPLL